MIKVSIVTAVFGGIDDRKVVPRQVASVNMGDVEIRRYFFQERNTMMSDSFYESDRIKALYYKAQHHHVIPESDYYIWLDGKIQVVSDLFVSRCLYSLRENEIAVLKHAERRCIYEEVDYIEKKIKKGNEYLSVRYAHRPIREQVEKYRDDGYPENKGLFDCSIIARKNTPELNLVFDEWWNDCRADLFDQTALPYRCWKAGIEIEPLVFPVNSFSLVPHKILK